jgi:transposase IS66 family protein
MIAALRQTVRPFNITIQTSGTHIPGYRYKECQSYHGAENRFLDADGHTAYKKIAAAPGEAIKLALCWTHLRRQFFDMAKGGDAPIASEALERIAALYAIEKTVRGRSADERRQVRQDKSNIGQSLARAATRARLGQGADR